MRVYISGKIGEGVISEATRQKFAKAEEMLKANGYETFNPTDGEWQEHLHKAYKLDREVQPYGEKVDFYSYALLRDMMVLATCDAVYFLEDWTESKGAVAERDFAVATGKKRMWPQRDKIVYPVIMTNILWHSHDERPVYEPNGDNRLITCLNMRKMPIGAIESINVCYVDLNPDGSVNNCGDCWHSEKWLKKAAVHWENLYKDTWWTYVKDIISADI